VTPNLKNNALPAGPIKKSKGGDGKTPEKKGRKSNAPKKKSRWARVVTEKANETKKAKPEGCLHTTQKGRKTAKKNSRKKLRSQASDASKRGSKRGKTYQPRTYSLDLKLSWTHAVEGPPKKRLLGQKKKKKKKVEGNASGSRWGIRWGPKPRSIPLISRIGFKKEKEGVQKV